MHRRVAVARRLPQPTDRIRLGDTQVSISPICLGAVQSPRTIAAAFEAGINHFYLTADMHWLVYEASRRGLRSLFASRRGVRDDVVVTVACYVTQPDFCSIPFQEVIDSVAGLGHVDVAVMGGDANDFLARRAVPCTRSIVGSAATACVPSAPRSMSGASCRRR